MDVIPASQLHTLRDAAKKDPGANLALIRLDEISALVSDAFESVELTLLQATEGPVPLNEAAQHLISAGGKRIRPLATLLVNSVCGGNVANAADIAAATELVHAATLLHDDVIDEGETRRGRPASRVLWGNLVSVLSGDFLLTRALEIVQAKNDTRLMQELIATLGALVRGEVAQLHARNREDIGLEGYLNIVRGKTASLFIFACRAGAYLADAPQYAATAGKLGESLGIAFQIIDDVLDLQGNPERVGKRLGADLEEGKTTLPLAYALSQNATMLRPLIMAARSGDNNAAATLAKSEPLRYGCQRAQQYARERTYEALDAIERLPDGKPRRLLSAVVRGLLNRTE